MLKEEDAADFITAMKKEAEDHESRGQKDMITCSSIASGSGVKTIQAIWSFKRKHFPNGELNKHKACLCSHVKMQQWVLNYWETYAPVVNWISIRFLLALSDIVGLESQDIDFILDVPQAELDVPVYTELSMGMKLVSSNGE